MSWITDNINTIASVVTVSVTLIGFLWRLAAVYFKKWNEVQIMKEENANRLFDSLTEEIKSVKEELKRIYMDHEKRITVLEQKPKT
jgi:hypothetical protein